MGTTLVPGRWADNDISHQQHPCNPRTVITNDSRTGKVYLNDLSSLFGKFSYLGVSFFPDEGELAYLSGIYLVLAL
jgi:hypothetical protein